MWPGGIPAPGGGREWLEIVIKAVFVSAFLEIWRACDLLPVCDATCSPCFWSVGNATRKHLLPSAHTSPATSWRMLLPPGRSRLPVLPTPFCKSQASAPLALKTNSNVAHHMRSLLLGVLMCCLPLLCLLPHAGSVSPVLGALGGFRVARETVSFLALVSGCLNPKRERRASSHSERTTRRRVRRFLKYIASVWEKTELRS